MSEFFADLLTALAVVVNGVPQGLLALTFGFAAFPTAVGFIIGGLGSLAYGSVATISFQAETITLAGRMGSTIKERLSIVFWGGVFLVVPALLGLNQVIIDFVGPVIILSMMAGVGAMLAFVSFDLFKSEPWTGTASMVSALVTWFITRDLAPTIIVSVAIATVVYCVIRFVPGVASKLQVTVADPEIHKDRERFRTGVVQLDFWKSKTIIIGALSLACLNIGANISFGLITGDIAGAAVNVDHLTVYSGLANMGSAFFGGAPVESIISGTASAPNPLFSSVLMMGIMAVILLARLLPLIGRVVHQASIAGFLFVLGAFVTFSTNISDAIATAGAFAGPYGFGTGGMVIGATLLVTAKYNPFFGLLAGLAVQLVLPLF